MHIPRLLRSVTVGLVSVLLAAPGAVTAAAPAQAADISHYAACMAHGQRSWPSRTGGTITVPTTQLSQGSTGPCVYFAQELLSQWDSTVIPDGQFGPITNQAVVNFQRMVSSYPECGPVDGIIGPRTWMCLETED
jgi:hypothetical protein